MPSEMTAEEFHNLPSPSDLERGQNCGDDGQQECTLHNLHCGYPNCPKGHKENETVREVTTSLNAAEQAMAIRTAAEALVNALTKEPDDYDGLVYYEYSKELAGLQAALSRGWLARKDDPVVIQDDGSGNQVTASGRVLR